MTASKNPENINVQLLSLAIVLSTSSAMAESLNQKPQALLSLVSIKPITTTTTTNFQSKQSD